MRGKHIQRKLIQSILLCLVLGSLFGGIVGIVMAGESAFIPQDTVQAEK